MHHICAKKSLNAIKAKRVLNNVNISINSSINLIRLYTVLHRRIHTYKYYDTVNNIVIFAYNTGNTYSECQNNVIIALAYIRNFLNKINTAVGCTRLV